MLTHCSAIACVTLHHRQGHPVDGSLGADQRRGLLKLRLKNSRGVKYSILRKHLLCFYYIPVWQVSPQLAKITVHYIDVIMTTMASQITSLTVVYATVYLDADQRKHQSSASLAFVWGIHRDRWIPRTKGQLRGKCFHLMTSSWIFNR